MANQKLKINTGTMVIDVENERGEKIGEFEFSPTDTNMALRFERVAEYFNQLKIDENQSDFELIKTFEKGIRDQFDYLLGAPVSEKIFGHCGALTVLANGDLFFEQVFKGIGTLINSVMEKRLKKVERVHQATADYQP